MGAVAPVVVEGQNCWRIASAERVSVIVDAADYYHVAREAMEAAQQRILILGWDFDTRISLEPATQDQAKRSNKKPTEETLGDFFLRLARQNPQRRIDVLKWSFGAKKQFFKPRAALMLLRWARTKAIRLRFDSHHPAGCSHHQKVVVIDDQLAVCGGIDMASGRWDTPEHKDKDPDRKLPGGKPYTPWHDVTVAMTGDIASVLGELGRDRWQTATQETLKPCTAGQDDLWPDDLPPQFENVEIAVSRTRAPYEEIAEVRENEALFLDMVAAAKDYIYFENQYFTSAKIAGAIAERLKEPNPPEFVMVMPRSADGWLEQKAMDGARIRLAREIAKVDPTNRFRIYVPVTQDREDIYVHAKVTIVDDRLLRVGSANLNNRSMGLDSEADVTIDAALPANQHTSPMIAELRNRLVAEHLGVEPEHFAKEMEARGSLVDAIEALRSDGRSLDLLDLIKPGPLDKFIADNELLDPDTPAAFLEPIHRRGLRKNWRKGAARLNPFHRRKRRAQK